MVNNIYAVLDIKPSAYLHRPSVVETPKLTYTRGATMIVSFETADRVYDFEDVKQLTFIFKQGRRLFDPLQAIGYNPPNDDYSDELWYFNPGFSMVGTEVLLALDPQMTKLFKTTERSGTMVELEVVVELNSGETIIERMPQIEILDSIYSKIISDEHVYCSEQTVCSEDLVCHD